jgi:mannose-6-phosphate isomerase-like protein (cupin superfamily)
MKMADGKLIKLAELQSVCPPGHINTETLEIITKNTVGAEHIELFLSEMHPGGEAEESVHPFSEHGYFMISGVGEAVVEGKRFTLHPNECLYIPPGAKHGIKPVGKNTIRVIVFMSPPRE